MKKITFIAVVILAAVSCTPQENPSLNEGIVVSDAWLRPPLPGKVSAGYFNITNHGDKADKLVAAESPIAGSIELHTVAMADGVMKMRRVDAVDLAPGETVSFKPGGLHLMLFDVELAADRNDARVTLIFENAEPVTVLAALTNTPARKTDDHTNH
ncbi:MAG: copper chaperone PCu(A)C [Hyphomonadaceae bacterium]|nr:copper chaperone PCu(A)C [Hyphomonadaceae bacterium]